MAMAGDGCFIAWHDLKAGYEATHDHWHTHEHMIERLAIPGFRRGLRYRSLIGSPRVCVMYQVETLGVFSSTAYLERLNNPTPWTRRTLPLFVGMNRTLCVVGSSHGQGIGGYLVTVQLSPRQGQEDRLREWLAQDALPGLTQRPGLNGAHFLIGDRALSEIKTQEKALRGTPDAVADWVVLVEGYDRSAVEAVLADFRASDGLAAHGAAEQMTIGLYSLDFTLDESEAKSIWRGPAV